MNLGILTTNVKYFILNKLFIILIYWHLLHILFNDKNHWVLWKSLIG